MMGASIAVVLATGMLLLLGLGAFSIISLREGERRAARVAGALAVVLSAPFFIVIAMRPPVPLVAASSVAALAAVGVVLWFLPIGGKAPFGGQPTRRMDERDIMFARGRLVSGSSDYEAYYSMRPAHKMGDDHTRSLAGLLSPEAELAEPLAFAAAEASFDLTEAVREHVDGEVAAERVVRSPERWVGALERLAKSYGALDMGVTDLRPYHLYTHIGRGTGIYGAPIDLDHRWAVAFSVEMDHRNISHAPAAPVIEESAHQYVEAAKIALILASWMRRLGYPARAHIDGNYRVIAPLVARDAGLGEIGRMGLLMTPHLGPRVRLGVVTTEMPLVPDSRGDDASVLDFCNVCRKCATNCPVGAISSGDRIAVDDGLRWAIDSETCYRYWNVIGTDCATCVRVCPYSHPDNAAHNLVRWAAGRSGTARRAALWLDDLFYGRNPSNPQ